jgi:hypothetical protein
MTEKLKTQGRLHKMRHIDQVIEGNKAAGGTFFDRRTVLYFKSKVLPTVYGRKYFISYDLTDEGKRYTVRRVLTNALIGKAGELHGHASQKSALDAISALLWDTITV